MVRVFKVEEQCIINFFGNDLFYVDKSNNQPKLLYLEYYLILKTYLLQDHSKCNGKSL